MTMKPMSTLSFNGEDAFEIKDSEAREALDTLNTELDKSKREISEQIGVLERLQPDTAMVGHILEVDSVDETGKPLTYRAVENKPDIEVDDTLTQEGMAADAKATGEALKNISVDETLTLEEYQALSEEEKNSNKTFYIKDADIIDIKNVAKTCAKHIAFDNTNTTLTSKEVQGALVEVDNKLANKADCIATTASGETIVVTDSDEEKPLGLAIDGKSEQTRYSGNQLFDASLIPTKTINNTTVTNNGDGSFTINGVNNDSISHFANVSPSLFKAGKVYLKTNIHSQPFFYVSFVNPNGNIEINNCNSTLVSADLTEEFLSGVTNVRFGFFGSGTYEVYNGVITPMVYQDGDGTFEPYCGGIPSPNPSYPQEIRNIGVYDESNGKYAVEVKFTGKNLLNVISKISTDKGVTYNSDNGTVIANGTATGGASIWSASSNDKELLARVIGKEVILSGCPSGGSASTYYLQIWYKLRNGNTYTIRDIGDGAKGTINGDVENWNIGIVVNNSVTTSNLTFKPMLCYAEITDDTYEPYKETTATVYLDEPLRKVDKAYWNGGSKIRVDRNRTVAVYDGVNLKYEGYGVGDLGNVIRFTVPIPKYALAVNLDATALCDCLRCHANYGENTEHFYVEANQVWLFISNEVEATKDGINNYLKSNPITVEYTLAEPITEEIDIDLGELTMFYPTTILSNDCNANMEVEYVVDTKTYITKLENKIVEQNQRLEQQISEQNKKFEMHKCDVVSDYATNPIYFYKKGNNKLIYINGLKNLTQSTTICLCDVPDGYVPEFKFCVENSDVGGNLYRIQITSGKLYIYYYGATTHAGNLANVFYYF